MCQRLVQNTLFVGNGFSRAIFQGVPSWSSLFGNVDNSIRDIQNYTYLYEIFRLELGQKGLDEGQIKEKFVKKIRMFSDQLSRNVDHTLNKFGDLLRTHNINNIITTNYDNGIEHILQNACGYHKETPEKLVPEKIYSIRTYKSFYNETANHRIKLWKIHGDLDRVKSITLGFDQYCGALSKLEDYVKGSYYSTHGEPSPKCETPMLKKCKNPDLFDHISWAELFFNTNVYIVGFGMDFSEIDIWWLLNKRARIKLEVSEIQNSIIYLYNKDYESKASKPELFAVLDAFGIIYKPISADPSYLNNIFNNMT
jgi:hypothetical protein